LVQQKRSELADFPDSDQIVRVTSKESAAIVAPSNSETSWVGNLGLEVRVVLVEFSNQSLALKIPDSDSRVGGSAQPVASWGEGERVDDVSTFEGVQVLALIEIPQSDATVFSSRSAQGTVRRDSDSVDVTRVTSQVVLQLAVTQVPDLDERVPTTRDDHWVGSVWREADSAGPFSVSLFFDGVLALTQGVPQLDGLISGGGDDLSVVSRESNAQDVLGVTDEAAGGGSKVEVPQSQGAIPRARESKLTVRRDGEVRNKVRVSMERLLWDTVALFRLTSQLPDDDASVS